MNGGILRILGIDQQKKTFVSTSALNGCRAIALADRFQPRLPREFQQAAHCEIIPIAPLREAIEKIRVHLASGDVAVLASGDPLFFGIGKTLIREFGQERVQITPAPSSIQHAFARFAIPWDDASFVSLHGRRHQNVVGTLLARPLTAVLTDNVNRPETIAAELLQFVGEDDTAITLHVAENLGMDDERCVQGTVQEIAKMTFGNLSCMVIQRTEMESVAVNAPTFGLAESEIIHSRGLITKSEVRAAALHALAIPNNSIMWDIGAGSGSVSLEAARMHPDMLVYAIEKEEEQQQNILGNIQRYGIANLRLIPGIAPDKLTGLPRPQRIFIGGSGGNLPEIIKYGASELLPGGRMVVSAVLEKTRTEAPEILHRCGLTVDLRSIKVERTSYPLGATTTFNPITLVVGTK